MIWFLSITVCVLVVLLAISGYYLYRFANTLMRTEDAVEESLKVLERSYQSMGAILETPVGSDDPYIKAVVSEIKRSHDAVLIVANLLTAEWNQDEENDD